MGLINSGKIHKAAEFAQLNLRAAGKARFMSALQSASAYAAHGIGFLPGDYWETNRPLALKLDAMAHVESSEASGNEVLGQNNMSIMETLPFRFSPRLNIPYYEEWGATGKVQQLNDRVTKL